MKGKNKEARQSARVAKRAEGKPDVSKYAAKGGPIKYEFQQPEAARCHVPGRPR